MWERIVISWRLVRASVTLLRHNGDLMIFPIVAAFATLLVIVTFGTSVLALKGFDLGAVLDMSWQSRLLATFVFYLVEYTVIFYANTALVGAALMALEGDRPTIRAGLNIAQTRLGSIMGYAVIMATVGMILRWLYRRGGVPGRLLGPFVQRYLIFSVLGLAWHLVTFLVVPVLVVENVGPIEAVKRSARLIRNTWGEQIVGNTSIWLIFMLPLLIVALAGAPLVNLAVRHGTDLTMTLALYVYVMAVATLMLIQMALSGIFSAVVYRYAVDGQVVGAFDESVLRKAFRPRPSSTATRIRRFFRRGSG